MAYRFKCRQEAWAAVKGVNLAKKEELSQDDLRKSYNSATIQWQVAVAGGNILAWPVQFLRSRQQLERKTSSVHADGLHCSLYPRSSGCSLRQRKSPRIYVATFALPGVMQQDSEPRSIEFTSWLALPPETPLGATRYSWPLLTSYAR